MTARSLFQAAMATVIGLALALAGSDGGQSVGGIKLFMLLVIVAYAVQWIVYIPSYLRRTEHYYDLTGSVTYQLVAVLALILSDTRDARTVLLAVMIVVWALRLGTFLFRRVRQAGEDARFRTIKHDWARFLMAWTTQGLWITFTVAAGLAAMTSGDKRSLGVVGVIGFLVWLIGFGIEIVADRQKARWRANPAHAGQFITGGLWSWSRHPNYFGELVLWVGVAVMAVPVLQGWQYMTLLSPVFVYVLLNRISGIPLLERRADARWGGQADYEEYKAKTPAFFPRPPR